MKRITVQDLRRTKSGLNVIVADHDIGPAKDLGVECVTVDVTDRQSLRWALDGAFATIASLPYRFNLEAMVGALEVGAHYIDLNNLFHMTHHQLERHSAFESAGLMAVIGMGSAPGIVNVLAVHAARDLDVVREVHCLVGSIDRTRFRDRPPLGFDYSADTLPR
jgi:saccharopine dehydrogenase-like NADP-dependent oxidoreductase